MSELVHPHMKGPKKRGGGHARSVTRFCEEAELHEDAELDLAEFIVAAQYLGTGATEEQLMRAFIEMETEEDTTGKPPKQMIKELLSRVEREYGPGEAKAEEADDADHEVVKARETHDDEHQDAQWQEVQLDQFLLGNADDHKLNIAKNLLLTTALTREQIAEITGVQASLLDEYDSDEYEEDDEFGTDDEYDDEEESMTMSVTVSTVQGGDAPGHVVGHSHAMSLSVADPRIGEAAVVIKADAMQKRLVFTRTQMSTLDDLIRGGAGALEKRPADTLAMLKSLKQALTMTAGGMKQMKSIMRIKSRSRIQPTGDDDEQKKPEKKAKEEKFPRKYRVVISPGALVKERHELASPEVSKVPIGTVVVVAEIQGRRARLTKPVAGWCSVTSGDGRVILQKENTKSPEMTKAVHAQRARQTKILILKSITTLNDTTVQRILEKSDWNLRRAIEAFYIAKYKTQEYLKAKTPAKKGKKGKKGKGKEDEFLDGPSPQPGKGKRRSVLGGKGWWKSWKSFIKDNDHSDRGVPIKGGKGGGMDLASAARQATTEGQ